MKIMQMRYFSSVCRCGNVTRAAEELHVSQPSVSSSIRELEREFGVNLFYRQKKSLILTKEGEYFYSQVESLLARIDALEADMKNLGGMDRQIKIGVPPMIGTLVFPSMFRAFTRQYPDIPLEIQEYGSLQTRQLVEEDAEDVAIVILDKETQEDFNYLPIMETQLVFCVRRDSLLARMESVDLQALKDQPIVLMKADSFQNAAVRRMFQDAGIQPNVILCSSQIYTIKQFVRENRTGAFLFEDIIRQDRDLAGIPFDPPIKIRIGLIWKKGKYMNGSVSRLIRFTRHYVRPEL